MQAYLIFHVLVELFSVIVAWSILTVAWNSRKFLKHSFFLFLGVAYASTGVIDLMHTMAYEGMGIFPHFTANEPTQFWIAGRYLNAVSLLLAPLYLTRKIRARWIVLSFAVVTGGLLAAVFTGWFPDSLLENGGGLTTFKVASEYLVCGIIAASMGLLWHRRRYLEKRVLDLLLLVMLLTIITELAFTLYGSVYDFINVLGHLFKLAAFFLLYKAVVATGLQRPYEVLFNDLRLSEERYRSLVNSSPDAVLVRDGGRLLYANGAALDLYGASDFESLAAHDLDHLNTPEEMRLITESPSHPSDYEFSVREKTIIDLDGTEKPVEVRVSPVQYGGRDAAQIILRDLSSRLIAERKLQRYNEELQKSRAATLNLLQDAITAREQVEEAGKKLRQEIAERKEAEDALRQNQEDLNRAQAVGNIGSWRLDIRKNELVWSDENHRIFGIPKDQPMTYETFLAALHPDDRDYVDSQWQAALKGQPYDLEHRIIVDGNIKWVREKAYLEFDEKGELIGGFGITQDVTRRRRMQEKLRAANDEMEERVKQRTAELADTVNTLEMEVRQRIAAENAVSAERRHFRDVLDSLPAYVILLTKDYHIRFVNRFFEQHFGTPDPAKPCYELLYGRNEPCDYCGVPQVLETGRTQEWEWSAPDGRVYFVRDFLFTDTTGTELIMEMGIDITERKQAQERIRLTNILLELFTKKNSRKEYLDAVVEVIRNWSQCECIGIRLRDEEGNIPYESWVGFSKEFIDKEGSLSLDDDSCLCVRAVTQTSHTPDIPLATGHGSFHSPNAQDFVTDLTDEEKTTYRGHCIQHGFASLAVIPIRYRDSVMGVFHVADPEAGKLSGDSIEFLENMAMLVGEAVHRFNVEASLQVSRTRLLNAQHLAHIGNWEWDFETDKIFWSDEIYHIFGTSPDEFDLTYENFRMYVHPEDRQKVDEAASKAKKTGASDVDHRIIRPDGSERIIHEIAEVIYDANGHPLKMSGTTHDITEQKLAEQAIREHQQALRAMAAELQLIEERQRRQIAQDLHDSIGPILAFSTRELRSLKNTVPPEIAANLQDITEKIDMAIQQARTLSFDLSPGLLYDIGLEVAIEDLVDRFSDERKIPCRFQTCPKSKPLSEDVKIILYRSVRELLINAAKHAEPSKVDVAIHHDDAYICVRVEDDGLGFDAKILNQEAEKKGFGLFSIRERLTHIGGDLKIESAPGKGTIMILTAPLDLSRE